MLVAKGAYHATKWTLEKWIRFQESSIKVFLLMLWTLVWGMKLVDTSTLSLVTIQYHIEGSRQWVIFHTLHTDRPITDSHHILHMSTFSSGWFEQITTIFWSTWSSQYCYCTGDEGFSL